MGSLNLVLINIEENSVRISTSAFIKAKMVEMIFHKKRGKNGPLLV
jgi:hypothetical protein